MTCGTSHSPWNRKRSLVPLAMGAGNHHPPNPHLLIRSYVFPGHVADPESFTYSIGITSRMSIPVAAHGCQRRVSTVKPTHWKGVLESSTETFRLTFSDSGSNIESCPAISHRGEKIWEMCPVETGTEAHHPPSSPSTTRSLSNRQREKSTHPTSDSDLFMCFVSSS